ncbi:hypothetical protein FHS18_000149 [Paenibacillus phyllosphaerae]|uniref:F5/8 type C domain-containing protein n=1 Tax=Paenibacillus phyllosphaerae TaxID=274593 RepID=A0A7W5ATR4_9BACL|nr:discoidin domain-containing protein [Paenibacillus phyllosphaerae]MBB3108121.1 hypothetical protein [Paenibacillus phyllosphaerae]
MRHSLGRPFAAVMILALILQFFPMSGGAAPAFAATPNETNATNEVTNEASYAPPSGRTVYNLNIDWRFYKGDVPGAEAVDFDDSAWELVSVPHTFNDVDTFDEWITHDGDSIWRGVVWYRKHFKLTEEQAGQKVFIEFEGIRQAAYIYVNGQFAGRYEAGVTPFGFDISAYMKFGDEENVIAVKNDNSALAETGTDTTFQWNGRGFNPVYGGLTRDVKLHVMRDVYFTLPLYSNLQTYGTYIYPSDISTDNRTATINIESEIRNESGANRTLSLESVIVDRDGTAVKTIQSEATTLAAGAKQTLKISSAMSDVKFWQPGYPYLYTVYNILKAGDEVLDVYPITTGFRKVDFRGGWDEGGVYINNKLVYLSGYAQRSTNEWALLGAATPQWLTDYDGELMLENNANFIRWMHISPTPNSVRMTDKYGIVVVHPAGDSEKDVEGRKWDQRVEVMRDTMVYFRNNPSILFWESGNNTISPEHMREMKELKERLDPHGMRAIGSRGLSASNAIDESEYVGTMLNRHYTDYARDQGPIIETEYKRDEAPRRVWDNASPPDFGYEHDSSSTWTYTSEEHAVISAAGSFHEFYKDRIQGPESSNEMYSGQAALTWADSNQHGRNYLTETARLSGQVDALRIPKESFYAFQVMQSSEPATHIVGHWSYPAGTKKDMFVIAHHVDTVELFVNGVSKGSVSNPESVEVDNRGKVYTPYVFKFEDVAFEPGAIKAVGYDENGSVVSTTQIESAGAPYAIKLTPTVSPEGWQADGTDPVIFDVEVVDEQGRRVPTDQARIDFEYSGPGEFLGGYNSGKQYSTFKDYIDTEAGINRVIVRSTREAGAFTLTAKREGLQTATVTVTSKSYEIKDGVTTAKPVAMTHVLPAELPEYGPDVQPPKTLKPRVLSAGKPATASSEETAKGNVAGSANDGGPTSRWTAGGSSVPQWWKVDLQDIYDLTGTEINWYRGDSYYQYKIEVSSDDRNWTVLVDETANTVGQPSIKHDFEAKGRFVRVTITGVQSGWASMNEVRIFGSGGSGGEWKSPSVNANYDFGPAGSPLETGYVRVSDDTLYTPTWEFGFDQIENVQGVDNGVGTSDLMRDYITGDNATFNIDLPNKDYDVKIIAGDAAADSRTELAIEGVSQEAIQAEKGHYADKTYKIRLTDGQLNIKFSGKINAIEIMPLPPVPTGLALYAKNDQLARIGWSPVTGSMGYKVYRAIDDSDDYQLIAETEVPVYEDTLEGVEAERLFYRVTSIMEMGEVTLVGESFPSAPLIVDLAGGLEPNWQEAFYIASDYFSATNPNDVPPIIQLIPELPQGVEMEDLIWSSSAGEVAAVDQYGILTAKQAGEAVITARTQDGGFKVSTIVYVPTISESFDNQLVGDTWGIKTGTAGGSGNLSGTVTSLSGNNVIRFSGGGTGPRSSQKTFATPITGDKVILDFDWQVGSPANSQGAQFSIEDSAGNRYLTLQNASGQEMAYGTGGKASNTPIAGTPVGTGFNAKEALYHIQAALNFKERTMELTVTNKDAPEITAVLTDIPFDPNMTYEDNVEKFQFTLTRQSGSTTSWTTWIDQFNVYVATEQEPGTGTEEFHASITSLPDSVVGGAAFSADYKLHNIQEAIYAQDILVSYDPEKLEFVSADSLAEGFQLLNVDTETPGRVHIIAASTGESNAIDADTALIKLNWKAKVLSETVSTAISVTNTAATETGVEMQVPAASAAVQLQAKTDKTALDELLTSAKAQYDAAQAGTKPGQYPQQSKDTFGAAIAAAAAVAQDQSATTAQVAQAVEALTAAMNAFAASVNVAQPGDTNGDGAYSIGDLGIVAAAYGRTSEDPQWNALYKPYDLDRNNAIDLDDLVIVAKGILTTP